MGNKKVVQLTPLGRAAIPGDLIAGFDSILGKTVAIDIANLPQGGGGGGVPAPQLPAQFVVRTSSYPVYQYNNVTGNTLITDPRLVGQTDYAVSSTQIGGGEFRDDVLIYDAVNGTVTIKNFQLQLGEKIRINAAGNGAAAFNALLGRLTLYDQILAPFKVTINGPNGGKVWWFYAMGAIPPGWAEVTGMRGMFPMAYDPNNPLFNGTPGVTTGGAETHTIDPSNVPEFSTDIKIPKLAEDIDRGTNGAHSDFSLDEIDDHRITFGNANPVPIDHINPWALGCWIEFIGV